MKLLRISIFCILTLFTVFTYTTAGLLPSLSALRRRDPQLVTPIIKTGFWNHRYSAEGSLEARNIQYFNYTSGPPPKAWKKLLKKRGVCTGSSGGSGGSPPPNPSPSLAPSSGGSGSGNNPGNSGGSSGGSQGTSKAARRAVNQFYMVLGLLAARYLGAA